MNGSYLLDTNIAIAVLEREEGIEERLATASETFLPGVVVGELYFGAWKSARVSENLARVEEFVSDQAVLLSDLPVAREYGAIKAELRQKGRPIPENDIWVAATARHHGLVLISRDRHFEEVEDLRVQVW